MADAALPHSTYVEFIVNFGYGRLSTARRYAGDANAEQPRLDFLTPDEERWAEALAIERRYGDQAPAHIAARIGELAAAGDEAGVDRRKEIASRLDRLRCEQQH